MSIANTIYIIIGYILTGGIILATIVTIISALYGLVMSVRDIFFNKEKSDKLETLLEEKSLPFKCKVCYTFTHILYSMNSVVLFFGSISLFNKSFNILISMKSEEGTEIGFEIWVSFLFIVVFIIAFMISSIIKFSKIKDKSIKNTKVNND